MKTFSIPRHYDASKADQVYKVDYKGLAEKAIAYKQAEGITNSAMDKYKIALMPIDEQITFGIPGFELFVQNAPEDTKRLAEWLYRNFGRITTIFPTMDTHTAMQIFHSLFFIDASGIPVAPNTVISSDDLTKGIYQVNPAVATALGVGYTTLTKHVLHYTQSLERNGKYSLIIWDYHAMLGGIGHALIPLLEEAIFFHTQVRNSQPGIEIKGGSPLTENYSVLSPEVLNTYDGSPIASKNARFIEKLLNYDMVIIAGQAKSHCVAFSIEDLLTEIQAKDPALAKKVYLLEDCTSPVVIPNGPDFTDQGNQAFERFRNAGMHLVKSTTPIDQWPDVEVSKLV
ncbi:MAG: isochorismatase [Candidatus Peribacteria bacterium]|jgi:nicotinamidase-related amidase|nr:isochorismatase [Candidatus Peribacteria bacterium]